MLGLRFIILCSSFLAGTNKRALGQSFRNSRAAVAAEEALKQPDDIEPYIRPRPYDPNKGLISNDPNSIGFWLYYDPENPEAYDVVGFANEASLKASHFDPRLPIKFLIHGFQSTGNSSFPQNSKNAYLALKGETPYNIFAIDWGDLSIPNTEGSGAFEYAPVVDNVVIVGTRVGDFIAWLIKLGLTDPKKVHVIGFSLGSHISGIIGNHIKNLFGQKISRITGLDPAGPEFYSGNRSRRITSEDAEFVDAIHTNAGLLGIMLNVGQVDFYVNGGTQQPGCFSYPSLLTSIKGSVTGLCSHVRATQYWTRTILDGTSAKVCLCSSMFKYTMSSSCCEAKIVFGDQGKPGLAGAYYVSFVI